MRFKGMLNKCYVVVLTLSVLLTVAGTASVSMAQTAGAIKVAPEVMEKYCIKKVSPIYPQVAKQARIAGTVVVHVLISATGSVTTLNVLSGMPWLRDAANSTVRKWQYKPYTINGQPVAVTTDLSVTFDLGKPDGEVTHPNQ